MRRAHETFYPVCYDARRDCKRSPVAGISWRMRPLCTFFFHVSQASCTLSEHLYACHQSLFQSPSGLSPLVESYSSNVWRVTCRCHILARRPFPLCFSTAPFVQECLVTRPRNPVTTSDPRVGAATGRTAASLTISVQHLERESRRNHLGKMYHPHAREGAVVPYREMFATSIGMPVGVTMDLIARLCIRKNLPHGLAAPTSLMERETRKTLQMQLWTSSRWST